MAEYIDRNALLKDICGNDPSHMEDYYFNAIANATTADVVEVVRCQRCRYAHFVRSCSKYMCEKGCGELKYSTDFCSYGERKEQK